MSELVLAKFERKDSSVIRTYYSLLRGRRLVEGLPEETSAFRFGKLCADKRLASEEVRGLRKRLILGSTCYLPLEYQEVESFSSGYKSGRTRKQ